MEEEANKPENEATWWEANVVGNLETIPRVSSPYPKRTSTLQDLEPDSDDDIIDVTTFFKRPPHDKGSPRPKQTATTHTNNSRTLPLHLKMAPHIYQ